MNVVILCILIVLKTVQCAPVFVTSGAFSGGEHDEDIKHHREENGHDFSTKSTLTDRQSEHGFKSNNKNELVNAEDNTKYDHEDSNKKQHEDEGTYVDDQYKKQEGASVEDHGDKLGKKEGHHKSGFHKTYHKDESGSQSNYYEDEDGEGKHFVTDSRKKDYGNNNAVKQQGQHLDRKLNADDDQKHGHYYNSGGYQNDYGKHEKYNQDRHKDLYEQAGKYGVGGRYGDGGQYYAREYQEPHHYRHGDYYDTYDFKDYPRRKITIYEDPRYEYYDRYSNHQEGPIHLDVRPSARYYQDYGSDYYYY